MSTIKGTNGVFKNPKFFPSSLKKCLKNPKLRAVKLDLIGEKGFSFRHM